MGAVESKSEKETAIEIFPELDGWVSCSGVENGNYFPGRAILCKTNMCSTSGQIVLDFQNPTLRFKGGLKQWSDMSKQVTTVDNSPQKWSYTFIEGKDIDLWLSAEDESKIAGGRKSSKEYKILFEHSKTISVDIEHVRAVFRDRVLNQATDGIQGETSFFVVTDVFSVDKVRCESSKRVDDHLEAKFNFRKGPGRLPGMGMNARRNRTAEISQSSDTQIALYMKCVEVKYDPTTEKISEIVRCDPSTFRNSYTVMDSRSHFPRYQYTVNNGSLIGEPILLRSSYFCR
ncbi:PREDICTED: LOW QUALITY PROTEIN: uncharacterized protein LOC109474594 [Branchiostoma belcheri]|uniref:LOW QUALITY PROTEIN: uncharacterized protein LOC109474594 n=1 Tax=Branchiostoma belcheri TaxID=7741 RepID=A0A6P4ZHC6_BRABE|nr:PREDICTED: LOW QUALITY PROTEIN: uncharacterized protein LOC109474594 [Branchiostoma belcheri]